MKQAENLLKNINDKIRNRNIFTWKMVFSFFIIIPFICTGPALVFIVLNNIASESFWLELGLIMIGLSIAFFLFNLLAGLVALHKSTQDTDLK